MLRSFRELPDTRQLLVVTTPTGKFIGNMRLQRIHPPKLSDLLTGVNGGSVYEYMSSVQLGQDASKLINLDESEWNYLSDEPTSIQHKVKELTEVEMIRLADEFDKYNPSYKKLYYTRSPSEVKHILKTRATNRILSKDGLPFPMDIQNKIFTAGRRRKRSRKRLHS